MADSNAPARDKSQPSSLRNLIFFALCFSVSLIGAWLANYMLLNIDVAVILAFSQEILKGKRLYTDLITSQPPFIFYFSMIPIGIHLITGIPTPESFTLFAFLLLQACGLLGWRIFMRNSLCQTTGQRYAVLLAIYYGLFIFPLQGDVYLHNFGQREHFFVALILPYILLSLNRLQGVQNPRVETVAAGLLGGIGFCIKPHFCLIFILSEVFMMCARRRFFAWNRPDAWIIAGITFLYYSFVVCMEPEYIRLIPMFVINYKGFEAHWYEILFFAIISVTAPIIVVFRLRASAQFSSLLYLLVVISAGEGIFLLQLCNYFYHLQIVYFFSLILFVLAALAKNRWFLIYLIIPIFFMYVSLESHPMDAERYILRREDVLAKAILLDKYKTVCFLNTTHIATFPAVSYSGAEWALSTASLDYLPTTYTQWLAGRSEPPYHTPEEMSETERYFHDKMMQDLQRLPDAVVIDESPIKYAFRSMKFNFLAYLRKDPRFSEIWKHYEFVTFFYERYDYNPSSPLIPYSYEAIYQRKD